MKIAGIILAAGQGKRMKSSLPKVLHRVNGIPMLQCALDTAKKLDPETVIIVAGKHIDLFREAIADPEVQFVVQREPKGTGDALRSTLQQLKKFRGVVVVLNGDTPLVRPQTVRRFLRLHQQGRNAVSVLSFEVDDPAGYGRIVRDASGRLMAIAEEKDADSSQKKIREVNSGVYAINSDVLPLLDAIAINRLKGEYYLTDIVDLSLKKGLKTAAFTIGEESEFMGVNTREELLRASELLRQRIIRGLIAKGINFIDPASVFVDSRAAIGRDTTIYPNVFIEGAAKIGRQVTIYPHVRISRSTIMDKAVIMDSTVIEDSRIRTGASIGPFARLRPGSDVGPNAKIGNFVELKKTVVGNGTKASHLSYLGDAVIGRDVNIGAGTITCNYDGEKKHKTVIGDDVFVGSDTQFVAPVTVARGAYVGAGSTITQDVPSGALAVSRTKQRNIPGWADGFRARRRKGKG